MHCVVSLMQCTLGSILDQVQKQEDLQLAVGRSKPAAVLIFLCLVVVVEVPLATEQTQGTVGLITWGGEKRNQQLIMPDLFPRLSMCWRCQQAGVLPSNVKKLRYAS